MPRESEPSLNEKAFVLQALQEGVRIDGRGFGELRSLDLQLGDEYGIADVRWGRTRLVSSCSRCRMSLSLELTSLLGSSLEYRPKSPSPMSTGLLLGYSPSAPS